MADSQKRNRLLVVDFNKAISVSYLTGDEKSELREAISKVLDKAKITGYEIVFRGDENYV